MAGKIEDLDGIKSEDDGGSTIDIDLNDINGLDDQAGGGAAEFMSQDLVPLARTLPLELARGPAANADAGPAGESSRELTHAGPSRPAPDMKNVAHFLNKLYTMVNDPSTDAMIRWSDSGESFLVLRQNSLANQVLPYYFKHSNFSSFVRQLNMYGFHKVPHVQQGVLKPDGSAEILEFSNPNFIRDQPDLLCLVTRKRGGPQDSSKLDIAALMNEIQAIRKHQVTLSSDLRRVQQDNEAMWRQEMASRERQQQQQQTIDRIVKFLAGMYGKQRNSILAEAAAGSGGSGNNSPRRNTASSFTMDDDRFSPVYNQDFSDLLASQQGVSSPTAAAVAAASGAATPQSTASSSRTRSSQSMDRALALSRRRDRKAGQKASPERENQTPGPEWPGAAGIENIDANLAESVQSLDNLAQLLGVDVSELEAMNSAANASPPGGGAGVELDESRRFQPLDPAADMDDVFDLADYGGDFDGNAALNDHMAGGHAAAADKTPEQQAPGHARFESVHSSSPSVSPDTSTGSVHSSPRQSSVSPPVQAAPASDTVLPKKRKTEG